jgi:hypothetical protein
MEAFETIIPAASNSKRCLTLPLIPGENWLPTYAKAYQRRKTLYLALLLVEFLIQNYISISAKTLERHCKLL